MVQGWQHCVQWGHENTQGEDSLAMGLEYTRVTVTQLASGHRERGSSFSMILSSVGNKWFGHLSCKASVRVDIDCQLPGIYSHHGNKPLGTSVMEFLDRVN